MTPKEFRAKVRQEALSAAYNTAAAYGALGEQIGAELLKEKGDSHPYVEGDPINAAKIIAWSRMVRNASPGRKWTDTEIRMADAIARIAGGE